MAALPPALQRVLAVIQEPESRERHRRFFAGALDAIARLTAIDLSGAGRGHPGEHDTALWESIAPALRDALHAVHAYFEMVLEVFPTPPERVVADNWDDVFAENGEHAATAVDGPPKSPMEATLEVLHTILRQLQSEIGSFGRDLRNPAKVFDHWRLLDMLGAFRGKFRHGIGEMLYAAASLHDDANRDEVVPFWRSEVNASVCLRRGLYDLRQRVRTYRQVLDTMTAVPHSWVQALLNELTVFHGTDAYRFMRWDDKPSFNDACLAVANLAAERVEDLRKVLPVVEGLVAFLDLLALINRRAILIIHDQQVLREALASIDSVLQDTVRGAEARRLMQLALTHAEQVHGRDGDLDKVIDTLGRIPIQELPREQLLRLAQRFKDHASAIRF